MAQMSLVKARELIGWTQSRLARESGESVSTIRDLEIGDIKRPSYEVVMRVIGALRNGGLTGINPEDIFPVPDRSEVA